jgi:hypothetical protein
MEWKKQNNGKTAVPPIPGEVIKRKLKKYLTKISKDERKENEKLSFWGYYNNFLYRMGKRYRTHLEKGTPIAPKTIFQFHNLKRHLQKL